MWGGSSHGAVPPTTHIIPATGSVFDLGSSAKPFRKAYLSSDLTIGGNVLAGGIGITSLIGINTSFGDDSGVLLCSACNEPDESDAPDRAASCILYGIDHGTFPGRARLTSGLVPNADVQILSLSDSGNGIQFLTGSSGLSRANVSPGGDFIINATDGGNFILTRSTYGVLLGASSYHADISGTIGGARVLVQGAAQANIMLASAVNTSSACNLYFLKSRATDGSADTIVANNDAIGIIDCYAADGATYRNTGSIVHKVVGTPGSNDVPSAWEISVRNVGAGPTSVGLRINPGRQLELSNTSAPSGLSAIGGYLYIESGALKYKGAGGTVTTLGIS
jgi:hypothetical protein